MPNYVKYPLETDPETMIQNWVDDIRTFFPNYVPADGQLAYRAATVLIGLIAEGVDVASLVPDEIFKTLGALHDLPAISASFAVADTTWVMRDNAGYPEIPAGTLVSINGVFFETTDAFSVPSGETTAGPIGIQAVDEGSAASGIGLPGTVVKLEEGYTFVSSITLNETTANGIDAEDTDVYLTRLRELFTLMSPRAIGASQLATMARTVTGVDAAVALKGYNPATDTWDNEGYAAVAVRDALGLMVPTPTKDAVQALLQGPEDRLINNNLVVIDPTWTAVDVTANVIAFPTSDPATVEASGEGAIAGQLDPSVFGLPPSGEDKTWTIKSKIWHYDIAGALKQVEGLMEIVSITIGLAGGAQVEADVTLPGVVPLPLPGLIVVNVSLP